MSADEMVRLLSSRGLTAAIGGSSEDSDYVDVETPGGGQFSIAMRVCNDAPARQCQMIQTFTNFSGYGVTLNTINKLLQEDFVISYAVLNDQNSSTVASKVILVGGITEQNLIENLAMYLYDLDQFAKAVTPGSVTQVSFKSEPKGKAAGLEFANGDEGSEKTGSPINSVGANAPDFLFGEWASIAQSFTE